MAKKIRIENNIENQNEEPTKRKTNKVSGNNNKYYYIIFIFIIILIILVISYLSNDKENKQNENIFNIPIITKTYYCPDDYRLDGEFCYKTESIYATKRYYCITGTLVGDECITETYYPVHTKEICPTGYSMFGFKCRKWGTSTDYSKCGSFDMTYSYATNMCYAEVYPVEQKYCDFGELYGNQCISKSYQTANYEYECPYGYTQSYDVCEKEIIIDAYTK